MVADALTGLLDQEPDPAAYVVQGRYIRPDGSFTTVPEGAVGIWIAGGREILAGRGATFMDYDGTAQPGGPDITTRGMRTRSGERWYLDVYPG